MMQLNKGLCYSPKPPEAYLYPEVLEGGGLAAFFEGDLQMWNLAWLTDPMWDRCLNVLTLHDAQALIRGSDAALMGLVSRALTMDDDLEDFGDPTLRELLHRPPREFMRVFSSKNLMTLELTATYGTPLIQTMWSRARFAQPISADADATEFVERALGKVLAFKKPGAYEAMQIPGNPPQPASSGPVSPGTTPLVPIPQEAAPKPEGFHGSLAINASTAELRMTLVAEEIIAVLAANPDAEVKVTVQIEANFPSGVSDQTKGAITENAEALGFQNADWE